jgi:hypothetical protein
MGGRHTQEPAASESFYLGWAFRPQSILRRCIAAESRSHKAVRFVMEIFDAATSAITCHSPRHPQGTKKSVSDLRGDAFRLPQDILSA